MRILVHAKVMAVSGLLRLGIIRGGFSELQNFRDGGDEGNAGGFFWGDRGGKKAGVGGEYFGKMQVLEKGETGMGMEIWEGILGGGLAVQLYLVLP